MPVQITLDLRGMSEVSALLDEFQGAPLNNRTRRALRAGAGEFRDEMRSQGKSRADLPSGFGKTRTRAHRYPLGVSVSPKSPLSTIFEHGARSHTIAPGRGILAGPGGERSRESAFFARGPVTHPGMNARPFIGPVFDAAQDNAEDAFEDVLFEGLG